MTASRSCSPSPPHTACSSPTTSRPTPRQRSGTLSDLVEWRRGRGASGRFAGDEGWSGFGNGSSSSSESVSGSDSAYGTLDEADSDQGTSGAECRGGWKAAGAATGGGLSRLRKRGTRSRSVGDQIFHWPVVPAGLDVQSTLQPVFPLAVDIDYDADTSFDSVESFASTTAESSVRSSPEPSECDFELSNTTRKEKRRRLMHRSLDLDDPTAFASLSRRHTVPRRRHKLRSTSISISIVSPSLDVSLPHRTDASPSSTPLASLPSLPPLTLAATTLSLTLSLLSQISPIPLLPASPVHLLHTRNHALLEYTNALLSPFLVHGGSTSALALAAANLVSLKSIEEEAFTRRGTTVKAVVASGMWVAIVALRVLLSWVFGRVLGWAHPEWFSTSAIHEVGSGLAPLLLAISIVRAYSVDDSTPSPSLLQLALLAANFCTPIEQGGSGAWFALSGAVVGLAVCAVLFAVEQVAPSRPTSSRPSKRSHPIRRSSPLYFGPLLAFLLLPLLATFSPVTPSLSPATLDASFAQLHPRQPHLLTILLMTAPRPGNPDYLVQTIESWLDALPEPSLDGARNSSIDRVRLIVYTHFLTHEIFDSARSLFSTHPTYAAKSAQYVEWHRDPRGANRLDQRLHVARGLEYAATSGGSSAYVMLAEDDFPLCPDGGEEGSDRRTRSPKRGQWSSTWEELQRVLLATNTAMPDFPSTFSLAPMSLLEQESTAGHCGLFVATGGSGLAMRGFIAAKLPALLLGEHDPHGTDRDERASRGEFSVKHEDEGADTPDLVIQDCLRGRLPECSVCEQPGQESVWDLSRARRFPVGSARNPGGSGVRGDRWGKSGLAGTERLMQHHLGYNASTLPGRKYGKEEWACGWRQPFNGEPDVLTV